MLAWAALSFLPDADVIGFGFGVRYEDEWGHRGATHSLAFALAVGVALGLLAPLVRRSAVRTGVMTTLVLASHSLLDTFTDGGLGCALLWPFDDTRYFAPWRPLPVSPIGLGYLLLYGMVRRGHGDRAVRAGSLVCVQVANGCVRRHVARSRARAVDCRMAALDLGC